MRGWRATIGSVIVDFHTHVFPPRVRDQRDEYLRRDPTFRDLYSSPKARIATAEDLLASMDRAGIHLSIILNLAWRDAAICRETNEYILEAAARSGGRLVPFCAVQPSHEGAREEIERCAAGGARGLGELRPHHQGYSLAGSDEADLLACTARAHDLVLLFHLSEPLGRLYPGKFGLSLDQLYRFVKGLQGVTVVAAHWGGGLPFYALMPEVREALTTTYFDTASSSLLYEPAVYRHAVELVGAERILFGSDFPLLPQDRCLMEMQEAPLDEEARCLILGENARRLLRLAHGAT